MDPDWDELREALSAGARSRALGEELAAALPARPRILYLQSGPAALVHWLAPIFGRAHAWVLADDTEHLVRTAFERIAGWAERCGWTITYPGRAMLVHTPAGAWRIEGFALEREETPDGLPLDRIDAVVSSALLDRVSLDWLARLLARLRVPFFGSLVASGAVHWVPHHPLDRLIHAGVARARSADYGFGEPPLGVRAPQAVIGALRVHGFAARCAVTDLRVSAGALKWIRAFADGAANDAIGGSAPTRATAIERWRAVRLRQALAGRLVVRIGQRDILGVPRAR